MYDAVGSKRGRGRDLGELLRDEHWWFGIWVGTGDGEVLTLESLREQDWEIR